MINYNKYNITLTVDKKNLNSLIKKDKDYTKLYKISEFLSTIKLNDPKI